MAPEAVLSVVVLHDRLVPGGPEGSRLVRAPGDGTRGRELLRLRLGERAWRSLLAPTAPLASAGSFFFVFLHILCFYFYFLQREIEILMFLSAIVMMKNRRASESPIF